MIYVLSKEEPTIFVILSEQDVKSMREGRTVFAYLPSETFNQVVVSLHKTNDTALNELRKAGMKISSDSIEKTPDKPGFVTCMTCDGSFPVSDLFEDRCVICWATEAKKLRTSRN